MRARVLWRKSVPAWVFLALVMAMCWRLWWPVESARRAFNYDALWQYWGDLQFQIDAWRHGQLPLWNPYDRGGYPAHADPTSALLYPVNWALVGLGLVSGPGWWLVAVKSLFHLWLLGLGTYVFVRRRTGAAGAYAAGALVVMTYPVSKTLWTALNWGAAWAPWMLLTVELWAEKPTRHSAAALAATFAMCHLCWAPAATWYALLVVMPYAAWAIAHQWPAGRAWRLAAVRSGALALALFAGMVAAQLLATAKLLPETVRAARDLDFVAASAFGADDLFGMMVPHLPGEMAYMGFAALLWATAAVSLKPEPRRLVLAGVAVFGVLCAFGQFGPVLPALASAPGPFDLFRRAHRYLYVTTLPLAILAGEGLDELIQLQARRSAMRLLLYAGGVGVLVFAVAAAAQHGPTRAAYLAGVVAALVGGGVTALVASGRAPRVAPGLAVAALVLDLFVGMWPHRELNWDALPRTRRDAEVLALAGVAEGSRIYDRELARYRPGTRLHLRDFGGYQDDPLALRRYALVRDLAQSAPRYLAHLGVRWLLEDGRRVLRKSPADQQALRPAGAGIWEVEQAVPAVLWVDRARLAIDEAGALTTLRGLAPGEVVVEAWAADAERVTRVDGVNPDARVPGRLVEHGLTHLVAEIDAPADGLVVVNEGYFPGWQATVDGAPAAILPANVMFRGVLVGPGHHRIEMRYPARAWSLLAVISVVSMLLTFVLLLRRR